MTDELQRPKEPKQDEDLPCNRCNKIPCICAERVNAG